MKLMSVLLEVICVGIEFHRDAPAKEKLVLNRSILGSVSYTHLTLPTNAEV